MKANAKNKQTVWDPSPHQNYEFIWSLFSMPTWIYKNQHNPVLCLCIFVFACLSLGACIHSHIKWDSLCVVFPDKSSGSTVLLRSLSFSVTHTHTCTHKCAQTCTAWQYLTHWSSLLFCSWNTCSIYHLPPTCAHRHKHAHTPWHKLANTHSTSKLLKQLKT